MNTFSWVQEVYSIKQLGLVTMADRVAYVDDMIRDPNVGTHRCRFKVVSVASLGKDTFRINLKASMAAVEKITRVWGEGMSYRLNGKRRVT